MRQKYLLIKLEHNREIKLCYKEQLDGTWVSTMESETMQDIETHFPDVVENRNTDEQTTRNI